MSVTTFQNPPPQPHRKLGVRILRHAWSVASNLVFLARTSAQPRACGQYLRTVASRHRITRYRTNRPEFLRLVQERRFSTDWFTINIPFWTMAFDKYAAFGQEMKVLEIGSWEGMSSLYILETFPQAHLTCVDTWQGADEHQGQDVLADIEKNFDANLARHQHRLTKYKGSSYEFFACANPSQQFDLVYIDGSHHSDDVMIDAIKGFERLKPGGIMIFDDYLWRYYKRALDNPAGAINAFLKLKGDSCQLLAVYWQVIIRKTAAGRRRQRP